MVTCRKGAHRSPVVAAAAAELLKDAGFDVCVIELALVKPFLVLRMMNLVLDRHMHLGERRWMTVE